MINRFIILCVFPLVAFADYELFHKSDTNIETYIDPTSVKVDTESNQQTVFVYHNNVSNEMSVEINYRINCEAQLLFHDMKKTYTPTKNIFHKNSNLRFRGEWACGCYILLNTIDR